VWSTSPITNVSPLALFVQSFIPHLIVLGDDTLSVILDEFFFFLPRKLNTSSWQCLKLVWDLCFVYYYYYYYYYYIVIIFIRPVRIRFYCHWFVCVYRARRVGDCTVATRRAFKIESYSIGSPSVLWPVLLARLILVSSYG
jgi:hypothetical protein